MNEFNMVSADELNQIEGGLSWKDVGNFLEKVAVAVVSGLILRKL
jgi:hypothetical protein